jgi:transposase-like protein
MRRTPSVDALIPALYLKGISTGDFSEALAAILGEKASGLSATNIVRLKVGWEADYKAWSQRDLSQKRYVYWWADGVYFNVRLDGERTCVLVLIGATEDGTKELLAVVDGYRESAQSWRELHWPHLRTTNPIESTFATVRLRTHRTKGSGSRIATLTMVFKLGMEASFGSSEGRKGAYT